MLPVFLLSLWERVEVRVSSVGNGHAASVIPSQKTCPQSKSTVVLLLKYELLAQAFNRLQGDFMLKTSLSKRQQLL
ncbi:MAG: hypothetical protein KA752_10080 [Giesbergeria sp.]|nr:hypothetical protein [Giesbergeria sp.]